jgi:hypothetical protein
VRLTGAAAGPPQEVSWRATAFRYLDVYGSTQAAQFIPNYRKLTKAEQDSWRTELVSVWKLYLTGEYETHVDVHWRALPADVDKSRKFKSLRGPWLDKNVRDEDLDKFTFMYPLRPDDKMLYKALTKVGLCTAGNGMILTTEEQFEARVEAEMDRDDGLAGYWSRKQQPSTPGHYRFFIDGNMIKASRPNFLQPFQ